VNATTTVAVIRADPDARDEYGDPVVGDTPLSTGNPASIRERQMRAVGATSGEGEVVRYIVGRVYPGVDVKRGDRVRDEKTGSLYLVDGVTRPQSPVGTPDTMLELRQVGG
jgi:hypothetical protein